MGSQRVVYKSREWSVVARWALAGAALTVGVMACTTDQGGEASSTTADEIIGGFPATSAKLNAIGAIGAPDGAGGFTPFCTGTLISSTMVLTAKHCVNHDDPAQLVFLIGPNAKAPIRVVPARGAAFEPTVTGGAVDLGSDVGILHLATPVNDVAPLPFAALTNDRIGSRMVAVGYGVQNTDLVSGTRQSGSMTLRATNGSVFAAIFGSFASFVQNGAPRLFPDLDPNDPAQLAILQQQFDETLLLDGIEAWFGAGRGDAQACTGDGGGPITAKVGTLTTVFGVSSWGFGSEDTCTLDGSSYASLNPVSLDFIDYETNCPLIPRAGFCDGPTVAVRCANPNEGGHRELRTDCAELDQICGVDENGALGCIDDACQGQHDKCATGEPLKAGCDACVTNICAVDSFCCEIAWDGLCASEVQSVCNATCPGALGTPIPDPRR